MASGIQTGLTDAQLLASQLKAHELVGQDLVTQEDTIADLRARTTVKETLWVSGYHTKNDGAFGSNIYRWNPTSTATDNGGTIIKLTSVATGRYELQYDGPVYPEWFGAKGDDGITDDTLALIAFAESDYLYKTMGRKIYVWDGTPLNFGDKYTLNAYGAILKLKAGTYTSNRFGIVNRTAVDYSAGTEFHNDITINGLTIDGNIDNVSIDGFSVSGMQFHQVNNITLNNIKVKDLGGDTGSLYGTIFRFCNNANINYSIYSNTDRQCVCYWESTGNIIGGSMTTSRYREPLLISSLDTVAYQGSDVNVFGLNIDNSLTLSGPHSLRFSGKSSGTLTNCIINGKLDIDGIYVTFGSYHKIVFNNVRVKNSKYFLLVDTDGYKDIVINDSHGESCTNGLRYLANGVGSSLKLNNLRLKSIAIAPLYINYCENIEITGGNIDSGSSSIFLGNYKKLIVDKMTISGMTASSYSMNISSPAVGSSLPIIANNILYGNTADVITTSTNVIASGNVVNDFVGAGIKLLAIGKTYIWDGGLGKLYTKTTIPSSLTDGTIIGTQS